MRKRLHLELGDISDMYFIQNKSPILSFLRLFMKIELWITFTT